MVWVIAALVVLVAHEGLEVLEGLEEPEDLRTFLVSHYSSFAIIISFTLNLSDMCILYIFFA